MGWTTPFTATALTVVTAAELNETRDNLDDLDRRATALNGTVITGQTTSSTSYTDLATVGPSVTVTVGNSGLCLVTLTAFIENSSIANSYMAWSVSGATTIAASDAYKLQFQSAIVNAQAVLSVTNLITLNPGSNTFTAKYRVDAGTGAFAAREIIAIPLGA